MFEAISLASGSSGNSLFVRTKRTQILIDAGISSSEIFRKLKYLKADPAKIDALFLTHEHSDHSSGIPGLAKRLGKLKVIANEATFAALKEKLDGTGIERDLIRTGKNFPVGDLNLRAFKVHHDAADPVGITVRYLRARITYLVDLGRISRENQEEINRADLIVIDSNYDRLSLVRGSYPEGLKKRIVNHAHLSNEIVGNLILAHPAKEQAEFWLAHLSEENNSPKLASLTINLILKRGGKRVKANFKVLPRKRIGPRWRAGIDSQPMLSLPGISIPPDLSHYRNSLNPDQKALFDRNRQRAREIHPLDIEPIYHPPDRDEFGWKVLGADGDGYVVAKDIDVVGVAGVQIGEKIWSCECGDFMWRCQKRVIPCKHIIRVIEWLSNLAAHKDKP
jgi:phosphoribosyl 1,2-cyclic phosphodiesterase